MPFADLPGEIVTVILHMTLDGSLIPSHVLCVCRRFCEIGTTYLYAYLRFTAVHQLQRFVRANGPRHAIGGIVAPRSLTVDLAGKGQRGVLGHVCDVLLTCRELATRAEVVLTDRKSDRDVRLKDIRLQMHSYARDTAIHVLERGLEAVSPDTFEWTGPDPDHHFSIAIVPPVASCLLKQFPAWRHIRHITVTNVSFATHTSADGDIDGGNLCPPLMGDIPTLRTLYIGQATFLNVQAVAGMFCHGNMARLEHMRLVDAYAESIWGPRLRRSDIEKAVLVVSCAEEQMEVIARVKRVVTCEKKTERIMGGDRVEGAHILI